FVTALTQDRDQLCPDQTAPAENHDFHGTLPWIGWRHDPRVSARGGTPRSRMVGRNPASRKQNPIGIAQDREYRSANRLSSEPQPFSWPRPTSSSGRFS